MQETISFIIPTRGRPESLLRLCNSIRAATRHLELLEVVLVVDRDDEPSVRFQYEGLNIRKVEVAPGLAMGSLNMAGYRAATGKYLMLLNDDIVLQTPGWDDRVMEAFRNYSDGMVLVHVNETIFGARLCTFPFLPRTFCELAGGICPEEYLRYRIDDHIHNVFDLLTLLGHKRRIYLPDVVFQHFNLTETGDGHDYVPNPEIHAVDTQRFEALLPSRKRLAMAAAEVIERRIYLPDVVFQHFNLTETGDGHDYVPNPEIHAVDTQRFEALLPSRKRLAMVPSEVIERPIYLPDVVFQHFNLTETGDGHDYVPNPE